MVKVSENDTTTGRTRGNRTWGRIERDGRGHKIVFGSLHSARNVSRRVRNYGGGI
jgi:hypothetical protein